MKSVICKKGYGITLDSLDSSELEKIIKELTVRPIIAGDYDSTIEPFPVYKISPRRIYMPKFYGLGKYGPPGKNTILDGLPANLEFQGALRPHQVNFCTKILQELQTNNSCIGCSQTGSGKSCCALWLACVLKVKTLIIVHKEFLLNQWVQKIREFVPGATIGIIQQNKCEVDNDIVIGMIQTIIKRDYPSDIFATFSLVIYDEVQHLGAKVFSQIFFKVNSKMNVGLSATPVRADGLTKVIEWFLGRIIRNEQLGDVEKPLVKFVEGEYSTKIVPKFNFRGKLNNQNMINQLVGDTRRNEQIVQEIILSWKEGRKILVLSARRLHCGILQEMLIDKGVLHTYIGLYLGGMTSDELDSSNKADIIIGTYSMISEAYDNPDLDTLVMSTGVASVLEQAVGRILRRKNKFRPLVIDFTDIPYLGGQYRTRKQFYKKKDFTILKEEKEEVKKIVLEECMFED